MNEQTNPKTFISQSRIVRQRRVESGGIDRVERLRDFGRNVPTIGNGLWVSQPGCRLERLHAVASRGDPSIWTVN